MDKSRLDKNDYNEEYLLLYVKTIGSIEVGNLFVSIDDNKQRLYLDNYAWKGMLKIPRNTKQVLFTIEYNDDVLYEYEMIYERELNLETTLNSIYDNPFKPASLEYDNSKKTWMREWLMPLSSYDGMMNPIHKEFVDSKDLK